MSTRELKRFLASFRDNFLDNMELYALFFEQNSYNLELRFEVSPYFPML